MASCKVDTLESRRPVDFAECERLSKRIYELVSVWEPLLAQQQLMEREFVENDLRVRSGSRRGQPLTRAGRRRRLEELLAVHRRAVELHRSLEWLERRREKLLMRMALGQDEARKNPS